MSSKNDAKTGSITDDSVSTGRVVDGDGGGDVDRASNARDGGSVTPSKPMPTAHKIDRRRFLQGVGVAGAAGVGLSGRAPGSPVGSADALPPLVIAGVAGAAVVGRFVRDMDAIVSDPPVDGLGPDAFLTSAWQTILTRQSTNRSTILDNKNILSGLENTAYTDGKIAAIEKINEEATLDEVQNAADDAARDNFATVERNFIRTWNETMDEFGSIISNAEGISWDFSGHPMDGNIGRQAVGRGQNDVSGSQVVSWDYTLANGEIQEVRDFALEWDDGELHGPTFDLSSSPLVDRQDMQFFDPEDPDNTDSRLDVFILGEFRSVFSGISDAVDTVTGGLGNWTANVYDEVQSGSIDVSDLLTPREQAELLSDDEEYPRAVADLIALNIPVDPDREATISFTERDVTISGLMAPTSPPENGFVSGETYDPSAEPWDLYFTYDPSRGAGGWSEVEPDIPEGEITFTDEPFEEVLYRLSTTTGDTVEVTASAFTESGGTWTADVSEQVSPTVTDWTDYETSINGGEVTFTSLPAESATFVITANDGGEETVSTSDFSGSGPYTVDTSLGIAEISEVEATIERTEVDPEETTDMFSEDGSAEYETVQISEPFTIDRIEDSEGNEVQESEFSQTEPQDDTNYITQEEWDELEQQNQELIDKYEEAASSGDGFLGGGGFGDIDIGDIGGSAAVVGAVVAVGAFGIIRQAIKFYLPGK